MIIKKVITGNLEENCYIIIKNNDCIVVDPGDDFDLIKKEIINYDLKAIFITHYHFDHIGALDDLLNYKDVTIYDYKNSEKEYIINDFKFSIIKMPGHTDDSVVFYFEKEKVMFVGDFVFKRSIGRTDLETGNEIKMFDSINKLKKYDKGIKLYPGHGDETTLFDEIEYNYFFNI